jgi:hypothetical protein
MKGIVVVQANMFDNMDSDNDVSLRGSFKKTIKENFLRVKWFLNHDRTQLLGVPLEAHEKTGLEVVGQLNMKKQISQDTLEDYILYHENGKSLEHSIGVNAVKYEVLEGDKVPVEHRKNGVQWMRLVSEWKWWEYSTLTNWGSNEMTPMLSIKSLTNIDETIAWLEIMQKGNYTDERFKAIEDTMKTLRSLRNEPPQSMASTQTTEPIDINKLLSNYSIFK